MNNEQLTAWLVERGLSEEAVDSVIQTTDQIKELYRESVVIGAALNHEDWIYEISTIGRSGAVDDVVWFLLALTTSVLQFYDES